MAAAALILLALTAGCARTTQGTVAMTTEPGPPLNAPTNTPSPPNSLPDIHIPNLPQIPGLPLPTGTPVPTVPAPPNAQTMTCSEYSKLDVPTRLAVVNAILEQANSSLESVGGELATTIADAACGFMPDMTVSEVLTAGG